MDIIRQSLSAKGFSDEAIRIINASWSTGTDKQYNTVWKRWCGWCKERQTDIIQASINDVVNFLADCFADGRSYSTINTYRSALSSTLCNINNVAVGSHPLVTRLLKGVYNLRTPSPRYFSTWDVTKVTGYLKTLFPLVQLSLKSLTLKTVMLCALSSALREQTLCALDIKFLNKSGNSLSFSVSERLKTSKPGKSTRKVEFISLPEDNSLYPVAKLTEYMSRTEGLRRCASSEETPLFISFIKPHKAVSTATVARWIKSVLSAAGIDTSVFKPHSVPGASVTHKYVQGVPVVDILRMADWSNEHTFRKYFLRDYNIVE